MTLLKESWFHLNYIKNGIEKRAHVLVIYPGFIFTHTYIRLDRKRNFIVYFKIYQISQIIKTKSDYTHYMLFLVWHCGINFSMSCHYYCFSCTNNTVFCDLIILYRYFVSLCTCVGGRRNLSLKQTSKHFYGIYVCFKY